MGFEKDDGFELCESVSGPTYSVLTTTLREGPSKEKTSGDDKILFEKSDGYLCMTNSTNMSKHE